MNDQKEAEIWFKQQYGDEFKAAQADTVELKSPVEEDFLLPQNNLLFGDDEDSWIAAKTRLGEDTVRLALLPPSLFEIVQSHMKDGKTIPSPLAKQIMLYSVSIRLKTWNGLMDHKSPNSFIKGNGKLYGVNMLCAAGEANPCETLETYIGNNRLILDHEFGFITEKGGM